MYAKHARVLILINVYPALINYTLLMVHVCRPVQVIIIKIIQKVNVYLFYNIKYLFKEI